MIKFFCIAILLLCVHGDTLKVEPLQVKSFVVIAEGNVEECKGMVSTKNLLIGLGLDSVQANFWARVAAVESGVNHSEGVGAYNNLFGMRPRDGVWQKKNGILTTEDGRYAMYDTWQHSVNDFYDWWCYAPPRDGETELDFFIRRQWLGNVSYERYESYYDYLQQIELE